MRKNVATQTAAAQHRIDTVSVVGIAAGIVTFAGAVMLWFEQPRIAVPLGAAAVLVVASHVILRWFQVGWPLAQVGWSALIVIGIVVLRSEWILAAVAGVTAFCGLLYVQWVARSLEAQNELPPFLIESLVPPTGSCEACTTRVTHAVAPLWCASFIFMTSVTIGKPRYLCQPHARVNAIPAMLFSAVFGWWGLPWGLWRTPQTIWRNLAVGGVAVDSVTARELYEREHGGSAGWFNFLPGVRSKPIAVLGLLLFMIIIFGGVWVAIRA